jgi:hypothetical protein
MSGLGLHPLCALFPRLVGDEFAALVADIAAQGLREPIVLLGEEILDGGNRYAACVAAGVEPRFVTFSGADPVAFVLSANLHRRHLSTGQQAVVVALAQDWSRARLVGGNGSNQHEQQSGSTAELLGNSRMAGAVQSGSTAELHTVADRAALSGASDRTQRLADKVARADPDLARAVVSGEMSLPTAVEQVTGVNPNRRRAPEVDQAPETPAPAGPDLLPDLVAADAEIARLNALVASLEAADRGGEIARLHEQVRALEGRLAAETRQKNEYFRDAKRHLKLLREIAARVGVARPELILAALEK